MITIVNMTTIIIDIISDIIKSIVTAIRSIPT